MVLDGECTLTGSDDARPDQPVTTGHKASLDTDAGIFRVRTTESSCRRLHICGRWAAGCTTFGTFEPAGRTPPRQKGDPFDYPKTNDIDRHFHDCDEYWFVYEGRGIAVSEGRHYGVGPGDCVATGMGHHHDFPISHEPVKAVYFETELEGQKRGGHLWEYRHGPAEPVLERQ